MKNVMYFKTRSRYSDLKIKIIRFCFDGSEILLFEADLRKDMDPK